MPGTRKPAAPVAAPLSLGADAGLLLRTLTTEPVDMHELVARLAWTWRRFVDVVAEVRESGVRVVTRDYRTIRVLPISLPRIALLLLPRPASDDCPLPTAH